MYSLEIPTEDAKNNKAVILLLHLEMTARDHLLLQPLLSVLQGILDRQMCLIHESDFQLQPFKPALLTPSKCSIAEMLHHR